MPYCTSTGFASSMLVKVNTWISVTMVNGSVQYKKDGYNSYTDYNIPSRISIINYSIYGNHIYKWTATFTVNRSNGKDSTYYCELKYWDNKAETRNSNPASFTITDTFDNTVPYETQYHYAGTASTPNESTTITLNWKWEKTLNAKQEIPKEVKGIGIKATCYLFGMLPNGTWWDGN